MKVLLNSLKSSLIQISDIIKLLQNLDEIKQNHLYCELNIGKHIRHVNDHINAVKNGFNIDAINYNSRNRGTKIETDIYVAASEIEQQILWLIDDNKLLSDEIGTKSIKIISEIDCLQTLSQSFKSSIAREFLYLINHTIHHAAHISLICKNQGIDTPLSTGMAPCTMTFLRTQKA